MRTNFYKSNFNSFLVAQRCEQFFFEKNQLVQSIERSLQFLSMVRKKKIILITTRTRLNNVVKKTAQLIGKEYLIGKWTGGRLTNQKLRPACVILFDPTSDIINEAKRGQIPIIAFLNTKNNQFDKKSTKNNDMNLEFIIQTSNQSWNEIFFFCKLLINSFQIVEIPTQREFQKNISLKRNKLNTN